MGFLQSKTESKIMVVGGRMGAAIINGWLTKGISPDCIFLIDQNQDILDDYKVKGLNTFTNVKEVSGKERFSIFLVALKPQVILKNISEFNDLIDKDTCLISIAAGISIRTLKSFMSNANRVVRVIMDQLLGCCKAAQERSIELS